MFYLIDPNPLKAGGPPCRDLCVVCYDLCSTLYWCKDVAYPMYGVKPTI